MTTTYRFSGHESFPCKSLWLKKGYDFVVGGGDFNSPEAVTGLGGRKKYGGFHPLLAAGVWHL